MANRAKRSTLRLGSDFAGLDSAHWALRILGVDHEHTFSCDSDASSQKVLAFLKPKLIQDDVRTRCLGQTPPVDLYMAGPPCQPYSKAGKRARDSCEMGQLAVHCVAYIIFRKPAMFVLEQVPDIAQCPIFLQWILQQLIAEGYHVDMKVLRSADFGVPQIRERLYLVGLLNPVREFRFPQPVEMPPVMSFIDVLQGNHFQLLAPIGPAGGTTKSENVKLQLQYRMELGVNPFKQPVFVASGESEDRCHSTVGVCMTITRTEASRQGYWCSMKGGFLTVQDISRLQGFPADFIPHKDLRITDNQMCGLLGNAMTLTVLVHLFPGLLFAAGYINESEFEAVRKKAVAYSPQSFDLSTVS